MFENDQEIVSALLNNNKDFKGSLKYYSSFVSVPIFYKLNDKQLLYIVKKIKTFMN